MRSRPSAWSCCGARSPRSCWPLSSRCWSVWASGMRGAPRRRSRCWSPGPRRSQLPPDRLGATWRDARSLGNGAHADLSAWASPVVRRTVAIRDHAGGNLLVSDLTKHTWLRSPQRIFAAKALASLTVITLLAVGLAGSGVVGGLAAVGNRPLVGLDGHMLAPGQAAGAVLLAWGSVLAPTLAFAAVGLLGSVAFGRSPLVGHARVARLGAADRAAASVARRRAS